MERIGQAERRLNRAKSSYFGGPVVGSCQSLRVPCHGTFHDSKPGKFVAYSFSTINIPSKSPLTCFKRFPFRARSTNSQVKFQDLRRSSSVPQDWSWRAMRRTATRSWRNSTTWWAHKLLEGGENAKVAGITSVPAALLPEPVLEAREAPMTPITSTPLKPPSTLTAAAVVTPLTTLPSPTPERRENSAIARFHTLMLKAQTRIYRYRHAQMLWQDRGKYKAMAVSIFNGIMEWSPGMTREEACKIASKCMQRPLQMKQQQHYVACALPRNYR